MSYLIIGPEKDFKKTFRRLLGKSSWMNVLEDFSEKFSSVIYVRKLLVKSESDFSEDFSEDLLGSLPKSSEVLRSLLKSFEVFHYMVLIFHYFKVQGLTLEDFSEDLLGNLLKSFQVFQNLTKSSKVCRSLPMESSNAFYARRLLWKTFQEVGALNIMSETIVDLCLELSQDDPFYQHKKFHDIFVMKLIGWVNLLSLQKLLSCKGLDVKETVSLSGSLSQQLLNAAMEKLLQFGRIANLDKVEVYFGDDACTQAGVYSVRNEISALTWIFSLIPASSCKPQTLEAAIREAVKVRISEVVGAEEEEARVDDSYRCEKESRLVEWGQRNGVKTKLQIAQIEGYGRGAIATEDLKFGDVALEIPISSVISEEYVYNSDMHSILEKIDGMTSETMMLLWTMREKHNHESKFKPYFDSLQESFCTGLSFGVDAIMCLMLLRERYDELIPLLSNQKNVFPPEMYTWEHYLWACELYYSNSMQIKFPDGKLKTCLIPVAGFLNHSIDPHIVKYGRVDVETSSLKFPLSRPCNKGEQCYLSYGNYSSSHLLTFYGFLPKGDNPYDVIPLVEMGVLENLKSTFDDMMQNLGEEDSVDRENVDWDVRMAMEFKERQRKIVSSILDSCSAGIKLFELVILPFVQAFLGDEDEGCSGRRKMASEMVADPVVVLGSFIDVVASGNSSDVGGAVAALTPLSGSATIGGFGWFSVAFWGY
ncbi:hypothetical protein Bca101_058129 [Brassica carinata]